MINLFRKKTPKESAKSGVVVEYKFINRISKTAHGYSKSDMGKVAKRYFITSEPTNKTNVLSRTSYQDLSLFVNEDCKQFFIKDKIWKIFDVGCGDGSYSLFFEKKVFPFGEIKYFGCEIDQKIVDVCRTNFPGKSFYLSHQNRINAGDSSYNLVFSSSVIHYTLGKWKNFLSEMFRVSSKYILLVRFPLTKFNNTFYVKQSVRSQVGTETHYFIVINRKSFEKHIESLGMKILARDFSADKYPISGIDEEIVLHEYLLMK